jgi:hypothetical protein
VRRRVATRRFLQTLAAVAVVGLDATTALAVCGDANGDGRVSVSDGVQTLRAAAGLSSSCDGDCDIDGSGAITVSDGVNVLRKAAGLATTDACPNGDPVSSLIGHTIDIFGPLVKVGAVGGAAAAGTASLCDNPDGGFQQSASGFTFDDCQIGAVSFTGFLGVGDGTLGFNGLSVRRLGDVLTLQGSLSVGQSDGNPELSGVLDGDSLLLGSYVITFQQVVSDPQGNTIDGLLLFDTSGADIPDVRGVRVTLTGDSSFPVVVTFTDDSTGDFTYDPDTDVLTPITGPTPTPTPPVARVRLFNYDDQLTAFLNGQQVLSATSVPGPAGDTGFVTVSGLQCGDNIFEFRLINNPGGAGYAFGVQLQVGGSLVVNRQCGTVGVQGCDNNNGTAGEVAKDVTFICVPCGPCTQGAGTCANPLQIPGTGRVQIHGQVAGANNVAGFCGGANGPESVFQFTPSTFGCYQFSTCGTSFDSQLAFGDGYCPGTGGPIEETCYDDNSSCADGTTRELIAGTYPAGQTVTILVDSEGSQGGSYTLDVRPSGLCIF